MEIMTLQQTTTLRRVQLFVDRFFWEKKNENSISKFQENLKTILDIGNDVFYQQAKYQLDIFYILGCAKIDKGLNLK
jgi:L-ribulose-5-phosphate 3-epimerase UlaE